MAIEVKPFNVEIDGGAVNREGCDVQVRLASPVGVDTDVGLSLVAYSNNTKGVTMWYKSTQRNYTRHQEWGNYLCFVY